MSKRSPSETGPPFTPLTTDEALRLWPLCLHARHLLGKLRYVDYRQAAEDAALLARELQRHYSPAELSRASFRGVPRGGLIVLGLLAYQLDLKPEQLQGPAPSTADLLCIVDDCALTGRRIQQVLAEHSASSGRIILAFLYAAPGLRAAVEAAYAPVERCITAHDLAEKAPPDDAAPEEARMQAYLGQRPYSQAVESVAFAWSEPDNLILTPFDSKPSHQWRFVPPHKCLKNRRALGLPPAPQSLRGWIVPEGLVYGWFGDVLYLLDTSREEVYRLDGLAAGCWRAAAGYGSQDAALRFLLLQHPAEKPEDLARQLTANLAAFAEHHLLQPIS